MIEGETKESIHIKEDPSRDHIYHQNEMVYEPSLNINELGEIWRRW